MRRHFGKDFCSIDLKKKYKFTLEIIKLAQTLNKLKQNQTSFVISELIN
jgi:hypothetical protein